MKKNYASLKRILCCLLVMTTFSLQAQDYQVEIQQYLKSVQSKWELTDTDVSEWMVSDQYSTPSTGLTYTYLHQQVGGIRIFGGVSTVAIRNGQVVHYANRFTGNAISKINASSPVLSPEAAIAAAAAHLELTMPDKPVFLSKDPNLQQSFFEVPSIAWKQIRVELVYLPVEGALQLAYDVNIPVKGSSDWWNVRIDALTGKFLNKNNWTLHCDFGAGKSGSAPCSHPEHAPVSEAENMTGNYLVFPFPLEAPSFGTRDLLSDPNSTVASPYGWHDNNGANGAEYTFTRGNNVFAYEDIDDNNQPGYSPDGGAGLNFDFPLDLNMAPETNQDAIITNLFYVNNMLHDVLYHHGFDEVSGNFQDNNYGNGGDDDDYVLAEAQDGGGTNNANFATPDDGSNGRMQMYLWGNGGGPSLLTVNAPSVIAGDYISSGAAFGPGVTVTITSDVVLVTDGVAPINDGCEPYTNGGALEGKIAVIDRGSCTFVQKVQAAEDAGAVAVIMINNVAGDPITMGGTGAVTIPSVMIFLADGQLIKDQLAAGENVNVSLIPPVGVDVDKDGSLDNGIIAHEYGHGVSNRLTGGPSNSNCLSNGEQGGEGWSDWLALVMTIEPGDVGTNGRGIGTYALGQSTIQGGIRRYRYSTDLAINSQTYGEIAQSTQVHDIGEIWCQALWEMTWNLIDVEGFDPDLFNGTGGNNTAIRLVLEGMRLQPCNPGYIDGRDAILAADELLYGGAHKCMIWNAFAKRGYGEFASQGSNDAGDETEDFTLPVFCLNPVQAPVAAFEVDVQASCFGHFQFTDLSTDVPQQWAWDFGDGTTSNFINPVHTYATPGTYTVMLTVTNIFGTDTYEQVVEYTSMQVPVVTGVTEICQGNTTTLNAAVTPGNTAQWSHNGAIVFTGTSFTTPALLSETTYSVTQITPTSIEYVGPEDNAFGTGGNHNNTGFEGRLLFEAYKPVLFKSALVYAQGAGNRIFTLYDENNDVIQTVMVNVPDGASRITLDFDIPYPGNYSVGNLSQNLYRNNSGADFPYEIDGLLSIYSSNSTTSALGFYYYLYDWEVQEKYCSSAPTTATVSVTPGPVAGFAVQTDDLNASFTDNSTGNPVTWSWSFGDGAPNATVSDPVHVYQQAGTYTVVLTVSDGNCASTSTQVVTVTSTSAAENIPNSLAVQVFPNPGDEQVTIAIDNISSGQVLLKWVDAKGSLITQDIYDAVQFPLRMETSSLPAGVYSLYISCDEGQVWKKIILF